MAKNLRNTVQRESATAADRTDWTTDQDNTLWLLVVGFLFAVRFFRPEYADLNDTLWISAVSLCAVGIWTWSRARRGDFSVRFGVIELCLVLLTLGHCLSTIPIFLEGGDRRAAVNVCWQWWGVTATIFLMVQVVSSTMRRQLLMLAGSVVVALACIGVWQHHVSIPQLSERYGELTERESELVAKGGGFGELSEVRRELAEFGVPQDGASRRRWEGRILHSTEPFATFALANTLGGLLAAGLALLIWIGLASREKNWRYALFLLGLGVVAYCFVLTKSRTAWVGFAVGMMLAGAWYAYGRRVPWRYMAQIGGIVVLCVCLLVTVLATGGLDRETFLEAPKSVQYRMDYWRATLEILKETPLLGVGPANFRSYYMQYRVPGASEAIAAPHNLFLDAWCAAGLGGLVSLLVLLGYVVWNLMRADRSEDLKDCVARTDRDVMVAENLGWPLLHGAVIAGVFVGLAYVLVGEGIDWRLIIAAPIIWIFYCACPPLVAQNVLGKACLAAFLATVVHLMGADGIEFPVVILLTVVLSAPCWDRTPEWRLVGSRRWGLVVFATFLSIGVLFTGIIPVWNAAARTSQAQSRVATNPSAAVQAFSDAIETDPWSLKLRIQAAELTTQIALETKNLRDFRRARRAWEEILARDTRNVFAHRQLGALLRHVGVRDGDMALVDEAVNEFERAVELSPTEVEIYFELAEAYIDAGNESKARAAAEAALELDDLNRKLGHTDILLEDAHRSWAERLLKVGVSRSTP